LSVHALQLGGGLACLVATMIAWSITTWRLDPDRTHFISEVLALPWWRRNLHDPGVMGSIAASVLFAGGALAFVAAAVLELRAAWTPAAASSVATGALLLGIVVFPLRKVAPDRDAIAAAGGLDLMHPFLAAVFYLAAAINAVLLAWPAAGRLGEVLVIAHVASSMALTAAVLVLAPRALGPAAFRPWFLPGVRILLDRRPPPESPTDHVRRLQWPCTILVALDLGLTPLGL
jgi:hypothetical protein